MSKPLDITIDEYVSPVPFTGTTDMRLSEVSKIMREQGFRHLPILKDNKPVGIISDRDISLLDSLEDLSNVCVEDVMVRDPYCAYIGTSISEVAFEMSSRKIGSALILTKEGHLDGIFTSIDGLNALIEIVRGDV
jgi:acetoin utilization protein AcuB